MIGPTLIALVVLFFVLGVIAHDLDNIRGRLTRIEQTLKERK